MGGPAEMAAASLWIFSRCEIRDFFILFLNSVRSFFCPRWSNPLYAFSIETWSFFLAQPAPHCPAP